MRIHYEVRGSARPALLLTHGFSASSGDAGRCRRAARCARTRSSPGTSAATASSDYPADPALYSVPLSVGDMAALLDADRRAARRSSRATRWAASSRSSSTSRTPSASPRSLLIDTGPGYRSDAPRAVWNERDREDGRRIRAEGSRRARRRGDEVRAATHRDATGLARAARGILAQRDGRVVESLPKIAVPTLSSCVGEHDEAFLAGSRYMAEKIPGAELAVIPGAGHSPNLSKPVEFHRALEAFPRARIAQLLYAREVGAWSAGSRWPRRWHLLGVASAQW